ncbi:MAG: excisionase [Anaerotruncus sp.]|nr:excisionase [Anaerotruncus sp.]
MHKRIAVAELLIDDTTGFIQKIGRVFQPEHLPIGVPVKKGLADRAALNEWWTDRSIPASRSGIREALETLDVTSTKMLLVRCYGLSLSDQYWICPVDSNLTWEHINFFENPFSGDMGDVLFGAPKKADGFDFSSPDNTSDGCLKKRWKILNGKRCLIKGGSNPFRQQPFNEVIAAEIMERLGIDHIPYAVMWNEDAPYSVCEDFVTADTELVGAWRIMQTQKKDNSTSVYQHFVNCCKALGAPNVVPSLDRMIVLDYIIANEDRHLNNFGLLRNAETLEWLGFAPIFDSGSSLGYDKVTAQIRAGRDITCKPFKKHHTEQLKLVSSFDWIDFEKLKDVESMITAVLSDEKNGEFIDESRISAIASAVGERVQILREIALTHTPNHAEITTEDDVEENIAENYTPKMGM